MEWVSAHAVELSFLAFYLAILAYHGWKGQQRASSLEHYLIGGRGISGIVIGLSYYATFVSSVTFVGLSGRSYVRGPTWWMACVVIFTSMAALAWFVIAPKFVSEARRLGSLTIADFLGYRYRSKSLRRLAGIVVVVASVLYMVAIYVGAIRLLEGLLHLTPTPTAVAAQFDDDSSNAAGPQAAVADAEEVELPKYRPQRVALVICLFLVVTTYTLAGGFHSVVSTDAVQGLILFVAAMMIPAAMILQKGGLGPLLEAAVASEPEALSWTRVPLGAVIGMAFAIGVKIIVEPRQLSRFYGLASNEQLQRGRWLSPTLLLITYVCVLPVGFLAHGVVPKEALLEVNKLTGAVAPNPDRVVPYLLGEGNLLGPYFGAFFMTGLIAAVMSSLDSVLLVAASSVDHDIIRPGREDKAAMRHTRLWVFILSAAAAILSLEMIYHRGVVQISALSGSIYAACFLPALLVGMFWKRGSYAGALVSVLLGLCVPIVWNLYRGQLFGGRFAEVHEVYVGLGVCLLAYIGISLATRPQTEAEAA